MENCSLFENGDTRGSRSYINGDNTQFLLTFGENGFGNGDGRRHDPVIALRAVETIDFMTAHWAHLPYDLLDVCSRRIVNEVKGISRVVYDISGKPPATIEWE